MIAMGLGAVAEGLSYRLGTLRSMGPGFFPAAVGALLALTGVIIAIQGLGHGDMMVLSVQSKLRGWVSIIGSILAFIAVGSYFGLVPATFAVVFISAMGDRGNTLKSAVILSLATCVVAVVVFRWLLQLQFPLF